MPENAQKISTIGEAHKREKRRGMIIRGVSHR